MERVKRLAGNEIELGIEIPTIESRASNILTDKGNYVCCHKGSTDKDLHRIWCWKYALEALIKLLFISLYHDKCLFFMLELY